MLAAALLAVAPPVLAQGWSWPWEKQDPPTPREPVYRGPSPSTAPGPSQQPTPTPGATNWSATGNPVCLQLEQRLVQESQRGKQSRDQLPKLESEVRQADRAFHQAQSAIDRSDCYEYFLFSKSLRRTRTCIDLSTQVEAAKRRLSDLESQRQQITASAGRSYQDDIVRELARNNCGGNYSQEARRRDDGGSIWQDEESPGSRGGTNFGALPYATYRTVCVRLCDGYYFPVSFSTLPNHFDRDAEACQSKCVAPVELYYYQNPGSSVDQMVAMKSQEPYTKLRTAFRYRKELVQGCSCKQEEYVAPEIQTPAGFGVDRRAEAPQQPAAPSGARQR